MVAGLVCFSPGCGAWAAVVSDPAFVVLVVGLVVVLPDGRVEGGGLEAVERSLFRGLGFGRGCLPSCSKLPVVEVVVELPVGRVVTCVVSALRRRRPVAGCRVVEDTGRV